MDMYAIVKRIFEPTLQFLYSLAFTAAGVVIGSVVVFFLLFLIRYKILTKCRYPGFAKYLEGLEISFLPYNFMRWLLWDFLTRGERSLSFKEYGFSIFCGRQGAGKTVSMVYYLDSMKRRYPECVIVTNFSYSGADKRMDSWRDLLEVRNDEKGVIFAIDEIHSEYSSANWKDFPESILSEISQQRKQKIKIVATSQVYGRVAKPIREQCFSVFHCQTYFGRLTGYKEYDAAEYGVSSDSPYMVKKRCRPISRKWFVQSNLLRASYDTYEKIERMQKLEFIPRAER